MTFVTNNNQETVLSGTWDNSAVAYTRLRLNVQDLNSLSTSLLFQVQRNGTNRFTVNRDGFVSISDGISTGGRCNFSNNFTIETGWVRAINSRGIGFSNTSLFGGAAGSDAVLYYDGEPWTIGQRGAPEQTTQSQKFRIYNLYTSVSNYERTLLGWDASSFKIETQASGSGLPRNLIIGTSSTPRIFVSSTGGVGIRTTTPFSPIQSENPKPQVLHVNGLFRFDGSFKSTFYSDNYRLYYDAGDLGGINSNAAGLYLMTSGAGSSPMLNFTTASSFNTNIGLTNGGNNVATLAIQVVSYDAMYIRKGENRNPSISMGGLTADQTYVGATLLVRNRWDGAQAAIFARRTSSSTANIFEVTDETLNTKYAAITSGGNFGINIANPTQALHVSGNAIITSSLTLNPNPAQVGGTNDVLTLYRHGSGGEKVALAFKRDSGETVAKIICGGGATAAGIFLDPYINYAPAYATQHPFSFYALAATGTSFAADFGLANGTINSTLNIYNSVFNTETQGINLANPNTGANSHIAISWKSHQGLVRAKIVGETLVGGSTSGGALNFYTTNNDTGSASRMYLDSSGNVGIGTTTPAYKLDVSGGSVKADNYYLGGNGSIVGAGTRLPIFIASFNGAAFAYQQNVQDFNLKLVSTGRFGWCSSPTDPVNNGIDTMLYRDAIGIIAQRNSTNTQKFRVYNTFSTAASSYEALEIGHTLYSTSQFQYVSAITSGTGAANIGIAIVPAGTGAFTLAVPNGLGSGGNIRGNNAVDLQTDRLGVADRVAAGRASFVVGRGNKTDGSYAVAMGYDSKGQAEASFAQGMICQAGSTYSRAFGHYATTTLYGQTSYSSGRFVSQENFQSSKILLRNNTSGATETELFLDGVSLRAILPVNTAWFCDIKIIGRQISGVNHATYWRRCLIENTSNTVQLVSSVEVIGTDVETDSNWNVAISADNTNKSLKIAVTGVADTNIRWGADVNISEITYSSA